MESRSLQQCHVLFLSGSADAVYFPLRSRRQCRQGEPYVWSVQGHFIDFAAVVVCTIPVTDDSCE